MMANVKLNYKMFDKYYNVNPVVKDILRFSSFFLTITCVIQFKTYIIKTKKSKDYYSNTLLLVHFKIN